MPRWSPGTVDSSAPVAFGEHDCPSTHQMMHPCVGTTVSWPALIVPPMSDEINVSATSTDWLGRVSIRRKSELPRGRCGSWTIR